MTLDVIISLSCLTPTSVEERWNSLNHALKHFYAKQTGIDMRVIIVRQRLGSEEFPKIEAPKSMEVKEITIQYPIYNKGWGLNVGAKASNAKWILLADSDMFCFSDYFRNLIAWAKSKDLKWAFAWDQIYYYTEKEKKWMMKGESWGDECPKFLHEPSRGYSEGGLVLFDRQAYLDMGGTCEWIQELGGIDTVMIDQTIHCYGGFHKEFKNKFPMKVYHLWHPQTPKNKRPTRKENIRLIQWLRSNPKAREYLRKVNIGQLDQPKSARGKLEMLVKAGQVV